ncbi:SSI family serine proteinase inhibitor [Nocardiopsis sp. YSL2]|uniref:SSI family serine proteinase inhibitor n=1 Tax=Nocardiopsis sp. YSL2 TaxID=2939492 RepID=UPI0026F41E88|nr:SSI family serine proteinase inhibitor [Nocardiopsis sp. YSL2]
MRRSVATITGTAAVLALGLAAPAQAYDTGTAAHYTLQLAVGQRQDVRETTLVCGETAGGAHPNAARACELIAEAGSVEAVMIDPDAICTLEYLPHEVTVSGAEEYSEVFGNKCRMTSAKGPVFDF